jgi:DNA-binding GntR family transcriptional regulator
MPKTTNAVKAYEMLKEKILSLELEPGALMNEAQLIEELKIGRSPIREAMRKLTQEGLVQILPRQGTLVSDISLSTFHEVFEFRLHAEGLAGYLAVKRGNPQYISELETLLRDAEQSPTGSNGAMNIEIDIRFHKIIYKASANRYLEKTLNELLNHSIRLANHAKTRAASVQDEIPGYGAIYDCFISGEPEKARSWMETHVLDSQQRIQRALESQRIL